MTPPRFRASSIALTPLTCQALGSIIDNLVRLMESSVGHLLEDKQTARRMLDLERARYFRLVRTFSGEN
jgi:hypothetical protein